MCAWLQAVAGVYQLAKGANDKANTEASARELENSRPKLAKDPYAEQNLQLVRSDLANGMSANADKAYNDIVDRQFSSSLSSLLKGGGDINSIGDIYGANEEGRQKLAMFKDNLRLNQIKNLMEQTKETDARNNVSTFQVNEFAPFQDKSAALGVARGQAAKEQNDAFNTLIAGLSSQFGDNGLDDKNDGYNPNGRFGSRYGKQGESAWRYAKENNMSFRTYKKEGNRVGKLLSNNNWF